MTNSLWAVIHWMFYSISLLVCTFLHVWRDSKQLCNQGFFVIFIYLGSTWLMPLQQAYWLPDFSLWIISFHIQYLCLNVQAIIIIAKLSFWINQPFLLSVTEALDQYKQKGYVQTLKTNITPDFMHCSHKDLVTLLYRQVTHIDGRYFVFARRKKPWYAYLIGGLRFCIWYLLLHC